MPISQVTLPQTAAPLTPHAERQDKALRQAAIDLEASFLAEMLKSSGLGKTREGLGGGGAGEEQFSSFLVRAQADEIAKSGGIGLAESLYQSLKEAQE